MLNKHFTECPTSRHFIHLIIRGTSIVSSCGTHSHLFCACQVLSESDSSIIETKKWLQCGSRRIWNTRRTQRSLGGDLPAMCWEAARSWGWWCSCSRPAVSIHPWWKTPRIPELGVSEARFFGRVMAWCSSLEKDSPRYHSATGLGGPLPAHTNTGITHGRGRH